MVVRIDLRNGQLARGEKGKARLVEKPSLFTIQFYPSLLNWKRFEWLIQTLKVIVTSMVFSRLNSLCISFEKQRWMITFESFAESLSSGYFPFLRYYSHDYLKILSPQKIFYNDQGLESSGFSTCNV